MAFSHTYGTDLRRVDEINLNFFGAVNLFVISAETFFKNTNYVVRDRLFALLRAILMNERVEDDDCLLVQEEFHADFLQGLYGDPVIGQCPTNHLPCINPRHVINATSNRQEGVPTLQTRRNQNINLIEQYWANYQNELNELHQQA